jgi:hypothetical protein
MKTASSDEDLAFKQPLFRMQIGFGVAAGSFTPGWCLWHLLLWFFSPPLPPYWTDPKPPRCHIQCGTGNKRMQRCTPGRWRSYFRPWMPQAGDACMAPWDIWIIGVSYITQRMDGWSAGELSSTSSCAQRKSSLEEYPLALRSGNGNSESSR